MSLKKALATLLATVMMLSLVSCGSKSNEEAPGDASKPPFWMAILMRKSRSIPSNP